MDNPGISLFQGTDIQINNSKNIEEEEDLEDQLRRKEELQNLLQANLDDFKYDDSTINSSANVSADNLEQLYKDAISPDEQLKVLYDVRCREIQSLKDEYDKYKAEKNKEIESEKHKNLLLEAELRQLSISLKNSQNLLADKAGEINVLTKEVHQKDAEIDKCNKLVKDYEDDLATYKSEVAELHLKLQSQKGPFNLNAKYNSEEFRKSLQAKIEQLENVVDERTKKFESCNLEKQALQEEVERIASDKIALEQDNEAILKTLDNAQQQCKDLIDIIQVLKSENDHFKGRLNQIEQSKADTTHPAAMDSNRPNENLKNMLVDKSIELDSLKTKLRYYENDLKELVEYRQLKCDIYKKEFKTCDNKNHIKDLLLMQNELQNYRRIIEDKNQEILNLNANNKDLKEKIEETLLQTRHEIQNISSKYNMPQLEIMRKELEKAEYTESILCKKLEESEERRLSLLQKLKSKTSQKDTGALMEELEKCRRDLKRAETMLKDAQQQNLQISKTIQNHEAEILRLKNQLEELKIRLRKSKPSPEDTPDNPNMKDEYRALKMQLKNVMEHLEKSSDTNSRKKECPEIVLEIKSKMDSFLDQIEQEAIEKGIIEEQMGSWKKLLDQIEMKDPDEVLKAQYKEAVTNLHASEEKVKDLEDTLQDLKNSLTIAEGEKCSLTVDLKECLKKVQQSENLKNELEKEIDRLNLVMKQKDSSSNLPGKVNNNSEISNLQKDLKHLNEQLSAKETDLEVTVEAMKRYEQEKKEARKWLEKMKKEIDRLKGENQKLECELKETRNVAKLDTSIENIDRNSDKENEFKARLEEEVIKCEMKLRDELQIEYQKRINDIEKRYQHTFKETSELCKQQKMELEEQDKRFREYLKMVLTECETCTAKVESEKLDLARQMQLLRSEYEKYKVTMVAQEEKYYAMMKKMERESKKNNEAWKLWSKKVVCSCLDIEATNKKVRDRVLASMERYDQEVADIQKLAEAKIATKKSSKKGKV